MFLQCECENMIGNTRTLLLYPKNISNLSENIHRQWEKNNNPQCGKEDRNLLAIPGVEFTTNRIPYSHVHN